MPSEQEALDMLKKGEIQLPPLGLQLLEPPTFLAQKWRNLKIVQVTWGKQHYDFGLEIKSRSTPRIFQEALHQALCGGYPENTYPMLLLPYLSEEQLRELETLGISGIDLCGNGVINIPETLLVFRTGVPNKFRDSASIKNIYRGMSSLVARSFLIQPQYDSVNALHDFVNNTRRKFPVSPALPEIAVSTVSKVLKSLEEDVIVGRESGKIKLLQPEKLLDKLVENYQPPKIKKRYQYNFSDRTNSVLETLFENAQTQKLLWVKTGSDSVNYYATMGTGNIRSIYCQNVARLSLPTPLLMEPAFRFPDMEILETTDETVYFDRQANAQDKIREHTPNFGKSISAPIEAFYPFASPVQTYLELMHGGPREKQTAPQIKEEILKLLEEKKR